MKEWRLRVFHKFDADNPDGNEGELAGRCQDRPCREIDPVSGVPTEDLDANGVDGWGENGDADGDGLRACCDLDLNKSFNELAHFSAYAVGDLVCDPAAKPKIIVSKLDQPAGSHKISVKGEIDLPHPFDPALDPIAIGARIDVRDAVGNPVVVADVPPGAFDKETKTGWKANKAGTSFTWKSAVGVNGITKVVLRWGSKKAPGRVKFKMLGKNGDFGVDLANLPLSAQVRFDAAPALTGQCAELGYEAATEPACTLNGAGNKVTCK